MDCEVKEEKKMKCEKCGHKVNNEDKYCQKCGNEIKKSEIHEKEINANNVDKQTNENQVQPKKEETKDKQSKKKTKIILGTIIGVIIALIAIIGIFSMPKDVEIEANELARLINSGEEDKYQNDNLYIHGYLVRDTRENITNEDKGYYTLVSDIDNWENSTNILVFIYEKKLDENLGTGSEVVIHGQLRDSDTDSMGMVIANDIEIKKKVDSIYTLDFEKIENNKYIDKQIKISGRMIDLLGQGHFLSDEELNHAVELKGLTEFEFASYFKNGSYATITGTLTKDKTIKVDKILQDESTKKMSYDYGISVSECYHSYLSEGEEVTIHGTYTKNGSYSVPYAIMDDETGQFIALTTFTESIDLDKYFESNEQCVITGNIFEGGTGYVLEVIAIG